MANALQTIQGKRVAWNSLLNFFTGGLLICVKIAFVPLMIKSFGTELYGLLSVTWMVLANFNWLDFGFSRATAKYVAQDLALGQYDRAASWVSTAVVTQVIIGAVGALVLKNFAPEIVDLFKIQQVKKELVVLSLEIFALSIPFDFASRSFSGVLEAGQRFVWINGLNFANTLLTFAVYSVGMWLGADFLVVMWGLLILRITNFICLLVMSVQVLPALKHIGALVNLRKDYWTRAAVMIKFGSWISAASVIGPMLLYFDQWMVSIICGVALLPYYTIPYNLVTHLGILSNSLSSTLFPAFSWMEARAERTEIEAYFVRAHRYLLCAMIPIIFVLISWSSELLRFWIGEEFASKANVALCILTIGFGIGLLAPLTGALLQAIGRPDLLVKLYLIELPFNVVIVWVLVRKYGIVGAAISYALRTSIETILLWIILYRQVLFSWAYLMREGLFRLSFALVPIVLVSYIISNVNMNKYFLVIITVFTLVLYCIFIVIFVFDQKDKKFMMQLIKNPLLHMKQVPENVRQK